MSGGSSMEGVPWKEEERLSWRARKKKKKEAFLRKCQSEFAKATGRKKKKR